MSRKVNPRNRPASQATVKRERAEAQTEAIMAVGAMAFMAVADVFQPSEEKMSEFRDKFFTHAELLAKGTVRYEDYTDTLKDEYDITLDFK